MKLRDQEDVTLTYVRNTRDKDIVGISDSGTFAINVM